MLQRLFLPLTPTLSPQAGRGGDRPHLGLAAETGYESAQDLPYFDRA